MGKYSQKNLLDAVNAVRQGALSYRRASKKYGVPVMTIQNRVTGKVDDLAALGRPAALPNEVELQIIEKLKQAAEMVGKLNSAIGKPMPSGVLILYVAITIKCAV